MRAFALAVALCLALAAPVSAHPGEEAGLQAEHPHERNGGASVLLVAGVGVLLVASAGGLVALKRATRRAAEREVPAP